MPATRKRNSALLAAGLCAFLLFLAGCGYTTRSAISGRYHAIYVSAFVNKVDITQEAHSANKYRIYRPFLESDITKAVIDKFSSDGNLRLVQEEGADLVLKGALTEFRRDPLRYDKDDNVLEYRLNLIVELSLIDRQEGKVIWAEKGFVGDTTYFTSGNLTKTEDQAINDALRDLARRIVERTVENW